MSRRYIKDGVEYIISGKAAEVPSATDSIEGTVILSTADNITTADQFALAAVEKNKNITGTIANQIDTLNTNLDNKVDKDGSKVLSTNDYTTTDKNAVASISNLTGIDDSTIIRSNNKLCVPIDNDTIYISNGVLKAKGNDGQLVAFNDEDFSKVKTVIDSYYNGELELEQITKYWKVGDSRVFNGIEYMIIDFEHDNLVTSINSRQKALLTLQSVNVAEIRVMNTNSTNTGGWKDCEMRAYLNGSFKTALTTAHTDLDIKEVVKLSSKGNYSTSGTENTNNFLFLLAEIEVQGNIKYSVAGEGTQYAFYKNGGSKVKTFSGTAIEWYLRSATSGDCGFNVVTNDGGYNERYSNRTNTGSAPAFCL